ncbi:S-adenosylmethionine decarboxylase [Pandoraea sp.]|uniref:S-adenosylmethionine decarboxylase n=1 Tax=Pandoraea sp. TaxID=1883445 RepID=UPI003450489C
MKRYIAIDVFTCGRDPESAISRVAHLLGAQEKAIRFLQRGSRTISGIPMHLSPCSKAPVI